MFQNVFLVIRYISFSAILFLNVLSLIFAAWNVAMTRDAGLDAPGASILIIFNSCATVFVIMFALSEGLIIKAKTAQVKFECCWTAFLGVVELAAAFASTVTGTPQVCKPQGNSAVCISATLLVPVTWLSCVTLIIYFLALCITTVVHKPSYPGIWAYSINDVPWFEFVEPPTISDKASSNTLRTTRSIFSLRSFCSSLRSNRNNKDVEQGPEEKPRTPLNLVQAPWAKGYSNRRGLDKPFATRSLVMAAYGEEAPPPLPPKAFSPPRATRYLDLGPNFPRRTTSPDEPVPRPSLSQWVRADHENGINVHTIPPISP